MARSVKYSKYENLFGGPEFDFGGFDGDGVEILRGSNDCREDAGDGDGDGGGDDDSVYNFPTIYFILLI